MTGAECLLCTLLANDVTVCFANPGTSEMQFVSALDRVAGMRGVLCLFEGVCSGAADGYARMTGKPAATLLHLGPGLGNALSNLHNARKAYSPVVNIVGEHSTQHLRYDAPLSADVAAFARTVSGWVQVAGDAHSIGRDAAVCIAESLRPPGQIATLIVPADFSWSPAGEPGPVIPRPAPARVPCERIRQAAVLLRSGAAAGLLLSGNAAVGRGLATAGRLARGSGIRVFANRYSRRAERGAGRFAPQRIPYFPEHAEPLLAGLRHLLLVEALPPVSFFGYPDRRSAMTPTDCECFELASAAEDGTAALEALAEECGAANETTPTTPLARPELPAGLNLSPDTVGRTLGALLPEGAIISDEAVSSGEAIAAHLATAASHDNLPVTGGSIGQGLPVALGAALACPDRKVIALEADGSGMYTLQALWTMARENLDVTVIILANRRYRILEIELFRTGGKAIGPMANDMMDISRPPLDWVKLAEGVGVAASRAATADEFVAAMRTALSERGPRLVEAILA
jgi:acetolactate synthase I/II/III large subunit